MMIQPKFQQLYWYVGENDQGCWATLAKRNENDWMDKFHMASGNCFATRELAEDNLFEQISQQTGEDGYQLWLAQQKSKTV